MVKDIEEQINKMIQANKPKEDKTKPTVDVAKVNYIMHILQDAMNHTKPNQAELAMVALTTLHSMLNHCLENKLPYQSIMGIQTPSGYEILYQIKKSKVPTALMLPNANPTKIN